MAEQPESESTEAGLESAKYGNDDEEDDEDLDLRKCAEEFSHYCQVDVSKERDVIESTIEDMLVRLDEFSHLADTVRNDSSQAFTVFLPQLHAKCQEMPGLFRKIDQLEAFVNKVKRNVDEMEDKVNTAEKELTTHTIKKVLSSLPVRAFLQKKHSSPPKQEKEPLEWTAPVIFKTSEFFGPEISKTGPEPTAADTANMQSIETCRREDNKLPVHPNEESRDCSSYDVLSPS